MANNKGLRNASAKKNDEFYTQLTDIEKEMCYYRDYFENKTIFCNCDDPRYSNFWKYFELNFDFLKIKRLIATHYNKAKPSYKLEIIRDDIENNNPKIKVIKTELIGNGDFRSDECLKLLEESDVVVTNPPFSLFREFVGQLMKYKKKFIIIGNQNAFTYKEIFPYIKENKIWLGHSIHSGDREFKVPNDYPLKASGYRIDEEGNKYIRVKGVRWFTNIDYRERHEDLILYKKYTPEEYPKFDNYNAINVDVTKEIPDDYDGYMGVPITYLDKYNPDQFEIIDGIGRYSILTNEETKKEGKYLSMIGGKAKYFRIIIKKRTRGGE